MVTKTVTLLLATVASCLAITVSPDYGITRAPDYALPARGAAPSFHQSQDPAVSFYGRTEERAAPSGRSLGGGVGAIGESVGLEDRGGRAAPVREEVDLEDRWGYHDDDEYDHHRGGYYPHDRHRGGYYPHDHHGGEYYPHHQHHKHHNRW